jgi:hypothetical protein
MSTLFGIQITTASSPEDRKSSSPQNTVCYLFRNQNKPTYTVILKETLIYSSTLKMEVVCSSETLTFNRLYGITSQKAKPYYTFIYPGWLI